MSFGQPTRPRMYLGVVVRNKCVFFYKEVLLLPKSDMILPRLKLRDITQETEYESKF